MLVIGVKCTSVENGRTKRTGNCPSICWGCLRAPNPPHGLRGNIFSQSLEILHRKLTIPSRIVHTDLVGCRVDGLPADSVRIWGSLLCGSQCPLRPNDQVYRMQTGNAARDCMENTIDDLLQWFQHRIEVGR